MTTSAFPPATPLLDALATIRQRIRALSIDDLRRFLDQALVVVAFIGGVLIALAKRLHQMLKGLIVLCRVAADLLEQLDDWIEYMIHANRNRPQAIPTPAPTPAIHPLSALADDLLSQSASDIRRLTGARGKRSKRAMVDGFISMPV